MIDVQLRSTIRRLHFNQHLTVNAVAETLGVHHETVRRAITKDLDNAERRALCELEKFESKVLETLSAYPKLSGTRVCAMLRDQGYSGGIRAVQRWLRKLRPRVASRVFVEMTMLPGEQAQVDWGHFGSMTVGNAHRKLSAFVMVLSYSRAIFVRFTFDQTIESLLGCHREAFAFFGGIPRNILYDNMKTVVADRIGKEYRFHNDLMNFASHYLFEAKACKPYQPQSKGRVERAIRYLRENFFLGRTFHSIENLNIDALDWCKYVAGNRPWPDDGSLSVNEKHLSEQPCLLRLPHNELIVRRHKIVKADAYGYIAFDLNRYSIPPEAMGKALILSATHDELQIEDDRQCIATYQRSWDKGQKIDDPLHKIARDLRSTPARVAPRAARLIEDIPAVKDLLELSLSHDQSSTASTARWLDETLQIHGRSILERIVEKAVREKTFVLDSLRMILKSELNKVAPEMSLILPENKAVRELNIRSHTLDTYDQI